MNIDKEKVKELLKKSDDISRIIEERKNRVQEISNKLIELNTKKSQILEDLQSLGVSESSLEQTISDLYKEVEDGIKRFDEQSL